MNQIAVVGVDLAKTVIVICAADRERRVQFYKQLSFSGLAKWAATIPPCKFGREACGSAHHWGRRLTSYGHTARLIAAEFVKPFRKSQGAKNDRNDAQAILTAVRQPDMRFVGVKSVDQQAVLAWHCMRRGLSDERTALMNRMRGLLAEFGVWLSRSLEALKRSLPPPPFWADEVTALAITHDGGLAFADSTARDIKDERAPLSMPEWKAFVDASSAAIMYFRCAVDCGKTHRSAGFKRDLFDDARPAQPHSGSEYRPGSGEAVGIFMHSKRLEPHELEQIAAATLSYAAATLSYYEQSAEDFRVGTRDHDVSQNIAALLRHLDGDPPFVILDLGCGPGATSKPLPDWATRPSGWRGQPFFCGDGACRDRV